MDVISGDDLILMVDLGVDDLYKRVRARLYQVDTPDAYRHGGDTVAGAVRGFVRKLVRGRECRIHVHSQGKGGWIVTLFIQDKETDEDLNLNALLISKGYVFKAKENPSEVKSSQA